MQALIGGLYYVLAVGVLGTNVAGYVITWKGGGEEAFHYLYRGGGVVMVAWSVVWNLASLMHQTCCSATASAEGERPGAGNQESAGYVRQLEGP